MVYAADVLLTVCRYWLCILYDTM